MGVGRQDGHRKRKPKPLSNSNNGATWNNDASAYYITYAYKVHNDVSNISNVR